MTRKSRKRKFGSEKINKEENSNKSGRCKGEGCEEKMKNAVQKYCDKPYEPSDCENDNFNSEWKNINKTYRESIRKLSNEQEKKKLNSCRDEKKDKCERGDTKPEVLLLTDEKDHLKDLEDNFPQSKESSISFPNIDKVNKKLSDLFDYIGKYTMEESEEKEELEKRKVEAEIEKAKAETTKAIRESERKFGFGTKYNESQSEERLGTGDLDAAQQQEIEKQVLKEQHLKEQEDFNNDGLVISDTVEKYENDRKRIIRALQQKSDEDKRTEFGDTNKNFQKEIEGLLTNSEEDKKGLTISKVEKENFFGFLNNLAKLKPLSPPDFQIFTLLLMKIMAYIFTNPDIKVKKEEVLTENVKRFIFESTKKVDNIDIIEIVSGFTPPGGEGFTNIEDMSQKLKKIEEENETIKTRLINSITEQELLQIEIQNSKEDYYGTKDNRTEDRKEWKGWKETFQKEIDKASKEITKELQEVEVKMINKISNEIKEFKKQNGIDVDVDLTKYCRECEANDKQINNIIKNNEKIKENYEDYISEKIKDKNEDNINDKNKDINDKNEDNIRKKYNDELQLKKEWNLLNYDNTEQAEEIYKKAYNELKMKIKEIFTKIAETISEQIRDENNKSIITENFSTEEWLSDEDYDHVITFHENIQSLIEQGGSVVYETNTKIKEHLENILDQSKDLVDEVNELQRKQAILLASRTKITLQKVKKEKYYEILFEKLQEESLAFKKSYEQGQKIEIMFQSFGYNGVDGFIQDNSEKYDLVDKIREKYINFKILEENDFGSENSSKIITLKELLGKCTEVIKNSRDPKKQNTIQGEFMNIYNDVNKIILEAFPVKSIINFSTNVKPPDEGGSSRETYTDGINYVQNKDIKLKTKFTENNVNMLDKAGQTPENNNDNKEGKLKGELGNTLVMIKSKDKGKTYGPFYKIFHTSNKDKDKKQYDIKEDLNRFFDPNDNLDHITYAGYGFSGSGKTYTLIEGKGESYSSIVNQISEYIQSNEQKLSDIKITIYEKYKEIYDSYCSDKFRYVRGEKYERVDILEDNVNIKGLAGAISDINKEREKNIKTGDNEKDYYRTSIRRTTYNPESSRAHLFVDIKFKVDGKDKKITVMDMAGSEKVDVIQEDYFESVKKFEVKDSNWFNKQINVISFELNKIVDWSTANACNISSQNKAIRNEFIKPSETKRDNYIIPVRWQELFFGNPVGDFDKDEKGYFKIHETEKEHSISLVQGWIKDSSDWKEHKDFIRDYNDYQFTAKFKLLFDFNNILKEALEKPGTQLRIALYLRGNPTQGTSPKTPDNFKSNLKGKIEKLFSMNGITTEGVVQNFYNIEKIYKEQSEKFDKGDKTIRQQTYNGIFSMGAGTTAADKIQSFIRTIGKIVNKLNKMFDPNGKDVSNVYKQKKEIESKIGESLKGYKITKKWNDGDKFEQIEGIVKNAYTKKETWDKTMISKYHCPLRFQGKAIMESIRQFKENLQNLNKQKLNFLPDEKKFPYNVNEWRGTDLNNKNFVIFTNIRLDFTNELCKNPKYVPICKAYDNSLDFSHELLYGKSEQQNVDTKYKEKVKNVFKDSQYQGKLEVKVDKNVVIDTREKKDSYEEQKDDIRSYIKRTKPYGMGTNLGGNQRKDPKFTAPPGTKYNKEIDLFGKKRKKKVSKKTSTRSFRKRGRRRGPSETEIL